MCVALVGCETTAKDVVRPDAGPADARVDGASPDARADAAPDARADAAADVDPACEPSEEICNGVDDDCDGVVDGLPDEPCYDGPEGTRRTGGCRVGSRACAGGEWGACEGQTTPGVEVCDGADNDCDGVIDDDTAEACFAGEAAQIGVGVCRAGTRACVGGVFGECIGEVRPGEEICDTVDNDCDGEIDEIGDCECEPGAERACYSGPRGTADVGRCLRGRQDCAPDGSGFGPCVGEVTPGAELCNGRDDDCDGVIDEALRIDEPCSVGVGACRREGRTVCFLEEGGEVRCGVEPGDASPERCNDRDDDCDGEADEGFDLGAACALGVGVCAAEGEIVCRPNGESGCDAREIAPTPERCNGLDDDCDRSVDEGDLVEACYEGPVGTEGVGRCRAGERACGGAGCAGAVGPRDEVCDGVDDDCDGVADEGIGRAGEPCAVGVGACRREGRMRWEPDGGEWECGDVEGAASHEVSNGLDDDCDGEIDEGVVGDGDPCEAGRGRCLREGVLFCSGEEPLACDAVAGDPRVERCDGVDDDCDGTVDERVSGLGAGCAVGVGACLREGVQVCRGDGLVCDATPGDEAAEICNSEDDDWDGASDEGVPGVGAPCVVGVGACARGGERFCDGQAVVCDAIAGEAGDEICNGEDDDCDGEIDDGVAGVGEACFVGEGDCRSEGIRICDGQAVRCDAEAPVGVEEVCDGLDNDCDGRVDEGRVCGPYVEGKCRVWLGWEDRSEEAYEPTVDWGHCMGDARDVEGDVRCVASAPDGRFGAFRVEGDVDENDAFAVAFTCDDEDDPATATWVAEHCAVFLGFAHSGVGGIPNSGSAAWGACPADIASPDDAPVRCTSSGFDGRFRGMRTLGGNVSFRDFFSVAFVCRDAGDAERAAAVSASVNVFLGNAHSNQGDLHGAAAWGPCPAAPEAAVGNLRCQSTRGDGRFRHLRVTRNFDNRDWWGVALRRR